MRLLTTPFDVAMLSVRIARAGVRVATMPVRTGATLAYWTYEELLDVAERAELMEPPDPPVEIYARPASRGRRPAA